jgi:putative two-component system response regulator
MRKQLTAGIVAGAWMIQTRRARQRSERFAAAALETLLRAIDANDAQTGAHVRRVATYALILADALGIDDKIRRMIELTALFHDIGKIHGALFDLVHVPRKLTRTEKVEIATHPKRGADVLAPIANFYPELAEAVLAHHERWDGKGYPRGLRRMAIPPAARVVAVADTFDAVTHSRRYRHGRTVEEGLNVLARGRGTQFDPALVDLAMLPPVQLRLKRAHRTWAHRAGALPDRKQRDAAKEAPKVQIRWRSRSEPPARVREKMQVAR